MNLTRRFRVALALIAALTLAACNSDLTVESVAELAGKYYQMPSPPDVVYLAPLDDERVMAVVLIEPGRYEFAPILKADPKYDPLVSIADPEGTVSIGAFSGIQLARSGGGATNGQPATHSLVYGRVPFEGYTSIEIQWNCQTPQTAGLSPDGFFVLHSAGRLKNCNLFHLITAAGTKVAVERDPVTGLRVPADQK